MSNAVIPLKVVQVLDPQTAIRGNREYAILKGGSEITYKPILSNSVSDSSITWTAPPPNPAIIIGRKLRVMIPVQFVLTTVTPRPGGLFQPASGMDAPRAYPVAQATQTLTISINNSAFSINLSDIISPMMRYNNSRELRGLEYSATPSMPDQSQNYSDLQNFVRNPLLQYGDNTAEEARGGFLMSYSNNANNLQATVNCLFVENLWLSPLHFGRDEDPGFVGVKTFDVNMTFGDLTRMWSHMDSFGTSVPLLSSLTASIVGGQSALSVLPTLLFQYITPQEVPMIPKQVYYSYYDVQRYPTGPYQLTSSQSTEFNTSSITLNSVPSRVYLFAREQNSDLMATSSVAGYTKTDSFAVIQNVSINWNNRAGLLSSASQYDLYHMSVQNGCSMSWTQWASQVGSVLAIDFAKDIGLSPIQAPGLSGQYQLQIAGSILNTNAHRTINYTVYLIAVSEGTMLIGDGQTIKQIGVISPKDVLDSSTTKRVEYHTHRSVYGGSFFSSIGSLFNKVVPFLGDAFGTLKKVTNAPGLTDVVGRFVPKSVRDATGIGLVGGARKRPAAKKRQGAKRRLGRGMSLGPSEESEESECKMAANLRGRIAANLRKSRTSKLNLRGIASLV
jgi:hypothetical protein